MKVIRELAQGTPEWLAWRAGRVGGSDIAAIVGLSPFPDGTRDHVFREKLGTWTRPVNEAMRRGIILEPWARLIYTERTGHPAPPACVEMDGCPWAAASLDGLCGSRILELKCGGWQLHSAALMGEVPDYYAAQVQWQMLVSGIAHCDFVSFNPSARFTPHECLPWDEWKALSSLGRAERPAPRDWLAVVEVRADQKEQARLFGEAAAFWREVEKSRAALQGAA